MSGLWNRVEFFTPDDFDHPGKVSGALIRRLDMARRRAGIPFEVTSDWREFTDGSSAHEHGLAVDIRAHTGRERMTIVRAGLEYFTRVGVYDKHVHLDCADLVDPETWAPDVMWVGESR